MHELCQRYNTYVLYVPSETLPMKNRLGSSLWENVARFDRVVLPNLGLVSPSVGRMCAGFSLCLYLCLSLSLCLSVCLSVSL